MLYILDEAWERNLSWKNFVWSWKELKTFLGHVFSERLDLLLFIFFTPAMNVTYLFWCFWYYSLGWVSYFFTGACQSFRTENPTLQRKNHDDNKTRESTVSFAILSPNYLTLVNWEIFQISPATVNKAINKAKGKINNYNRNWGEGGAFLLFFLPLPLD